MKTSGFFWSAAINGFCCVLILVACFVLTLVPIPARLACEIIAGLLPTVFICAVVGLIHYRSHLRGEVVPSHETLRMQARKMAASR